MSAARAVRSAAWNPPSRSAVIADRHCCCTSSADDVQQQWRSAMTALREGGFHAADRTARAALIEAMSKPERDRAATHPLYSTYRLIKEQKTFAFYTSRACLIEALDYRGNSYNLQFPACTHPEHHKV